MARPSKTTTRAVVAFGVLALLVVVGAFAWRVAAPRQRPRRAKLEQPRARKRPARALNAKQAGKKPARKHRRRARPPLARLRELARAVESGPLPERRREEGDRNVVLLSIDTLRADATTPGGARADTTPFLAELARDGIVFTRAFSPGPWTVPAMYSIFTGLYPSEHGIVDGVAVGRGPKKRMAGQKVLPPEATTLTERLKEAGFATFGVNTNYHMAPEFGFAQGFDTFLGDDFLQMPYPKLAVETVAREYRRAGSSFLWLHFFDPHFPYRLAEPWFGEWNRSKYGSYEEFTEDAVLAYYRVQLGLDPDSPVSPKHLEMIYVGLQALYLNPDFLFYGLPIGARHVTEDHLGFYRAGYLSTIRFTDEAARRSLATLGVDDGDLVIALSDHGEELMHHGGTGHRRHVSVYQELLHVPLIIRLPGKERAGTVIDTPVSTVDLIPTLLDLLGEPVPEGLSGVSLKPLIEGGQIAERPLYAEVKNKRGQARALIEFPWKYIYDYQKKTRKLYHLERDPGEKTNLAKEEPDRTGQMHDRLESWRAGRKLRWKPGAPTTLAPKQIKKLRKMGYVR